MVSHKKGVLGLGVADMVTTRVKDVREKGGPLGLLAQRKR